MIKSKERAGNSKGVSQSEFCCKHLILETFYPLTSDKNHPFYT